MSTHLMAAGELRDALTAMEAGDRPAAAYHLMSISDDDWLAIEARLGPIAALTEGTAR